jgi:hypothetical protein
LRPAVPPPDLVSGQFPLVCEAVEHSLWARHSSPLNEDRMVFGCWHECGLMMTLVLEGLRCIYMCVEHWSKKCFCAALLKKFVQDFRNGLVHFSILRIAPLLEEKL